MKINKTFSETIKIKDLAYLNDLGCEIIEYYPKDNLLNGKVYVTGAYHSSKTDDVKLVAEDLEFSFEFEIENFYLEDIECVKFEYQVVEGVGLKVDYEIELEIDITTEIELREELVEEKIEQFKEKVTNIVDVKLVEKIDVVTDNLPQNDDIFRGIKDKEKVIKVVYFNDEKELSNIASSNNIALDYLFKSNKHTDFNKTKRVIIKYGK